MQSALHFDARQAQGDIGVHAPRRRSLSDPVPRRIQTGQHLFHERDSAHFVYQIVSGVVRLTRLQKDGRRQVIAFGFPGDVVGLPSDGRHTTECDAIAPCEILAHRCTTLMQPELDPDLHRFLMQAALDEIRFLQDHFLMLGRRLALEKTAAFLTLLLDRIGESLGAYTLVRLPMNRSDIADYLGLTPETVSRTVTELRCRKVLALDDANTVVVLDPNALRDLADGA
ncbi:helix-turn-helix domain-containing protein [Defluviimonas sp. SAOS-178_SWC]|uniref:helix-turn-helix domain-containing protein n=1 Tax=Defluviimonas sp. SAOS-178_SWC TaxID=3121287 RepID=UPI003221DEA5